MIELLTPAEMAEADRAAILSGARGIDLMEMAGAAVAEAALRLSSDATRVTILCGPGNNGGDGFVAARLLRDRGLTVRVALLGDTAKLRGDAATAAQGWGSEVEPAEPGIWHDADLIIDALFGAGLARPLDGRALAIVEAINASNVRVLAVDLPSGISGESGAVLGAAVRATATVTFFRRKPGHLLLPGRVNCGPVEVADIGIPAAVLRAIKPTTSHNAPALWRESFPVPTIEGHKYSRGHVAVHSGGIASTGAARLAARAALRTGAGLVTIASPTDALAVHAASNLAVMVRHAEGADALRDLLADPRFKAAVLGPGGGVGQAMRRTVRAAMRPGLAAVLDADALTSFAGNARALAAALRKGGGTVLTPHEGEFGRLFGRIEGSKLERARSAAKMVGAVIVLKGADTVIASPDGRAAINDNAPPYLATAGAGDVLSGFIAGLLAQGMPAFEAAAAGVWLHGEAAAAFGPGLIADDLPEAYPNTLRQLLSVISVQAPS
jgi:hydroxyethylthiazole kinase-like uncharacterized protein yjeF